MAQVAEPQRHAWKKSLKSHSIEFLIATKTVAGEFRMFPFPKKRGLYIELSEKQGAEKVRLGN